MSYRCAPSPVSGRASQLQARLQRRSAPREHCHAPISSVQHLRERRLRLASASCFAATPPSQGLQSKPTSLFPLSFLTVSLLLIGSSHHSPEGRGNGKPRLGFSLGPGPQDGRQWTRPLVISCIFLDLELVNRLLVISVNGYIYIF
ncbi:putative extensin [Iris pallida]|uniref:Extensin n=1 Tax=Iris pallida TaxID=29817 RepID=A0AAX6I2Z8_IRIPA|nr:putative extensin [Iris pallida]